MRFLAVLMLVFFACAREQRPALNPKPVTAIKSLNNQRARYTFDWSIGQGSKVLALTHTTAVTDHGRFHFVMQKQANLPRGIQIVHRLEVTRTKKDLFTGVDGTPIMRWSSFVDEDRALWGLAFGDLELVLHAFQPCYFVIDNKVETTRGKCTPDFGNQGLQARELKKMWTTANRKGFTIAGKQGQKGLWTSLDIEISMGELKLKMHLEGKPQDRIKIEPPKKWVSDQRQRPWAMLQQVKKAIQQKTP